MLISFKCQCLYKKISDSFILECFATSLKDLKNVAEFISLLQIRKGVAVVVGWRPTCLLKLDLV